MKPLNKLEKEMFKAIDAVPPITHHSIEVEFAKLKK